MAYEGIELVQDPSWTNDTGEPLYCAVPWAVAEGNPTVHIWPNRARNLTFFFAGETKKDIFGKYIDVRYSHGVRAAIVHMFRDKSQPPGPSPLPSPTPQCGCVPCVRCNAHLPFQSLFAKYLIGPFYNTFGPCAPDGLRETERGCIHAA